jgi:hypothetical protein
MGGELEAREELARRAAARGLRSAQDFQTRVMSRRLPPAPSCWQNFMSSNSGPASALGYVTDRLPGRILSGKFLSRPMPGSGYVTTAS